MNENDQEQMEDHEKKFISGSMILLIILTLAFIVIAANYGIKINSDDYCGADSIGDYKIGRTTQNSTQVLNDNTTAILQKFDINNSNYIETQFCFKAYATSPLIVTIVDENLNNLSKGLLETGETYNCLTLNSNITSFSYLGVKCSSCSSTNNLTLHEEIGGLNVEQYTLTASTIGIETDNTLAYKIYALKSCKEGLKKFFNIYTGLLLVGLLIFGIFRGFKYLNEVFKKGW